MKYIWYLLKIFLFYTFYKLHAGGAENAKTKNYSKPKKFWYKNICHILTKKMHTHTWFLFINKKVIGIWSSEVKCIKWNAI